jgi:hypothetical protein
LFHTLTAHNCTYKIHLFFERKLAKILNFVTCMGSSPRKDDCIFTVTMRTKRVLVIKTTRVVPRTSGVDKAAADPKARRASWARGPQAYRIQQFVVGCFGLEFVLLTEGSIQDP